MSCVRSSALLVSVLALVACQSTEVVVREPLREGKLVDDKQEGPWTYRYPGGATLAAGEYRADKQYGPWTYWHENGAEKWSGVFGPKRLDGPTKTSDPSGVARFEGQFVDGFEAGPWTFYGETGAVERTGDFHRGLASMRWTGYYPDGAVRSEGFRWQGDAVGLWQYWGEDDTAYAKLFPLPEGLALAFEAWGDGSARREGFLDGRSKVGRWVTYHTNGTVRAEGGFDNGRATGVWRFWSPEGALLAKGRMAGNEFLGSWTVVEGGEEKRISARSLPLVRPTADGWSTDDLADGLGVREAIAVWTAEMFGSATPVTATSTGGLPEPPAELLADSADRPLIPMAPQPWTNYEREAVATLIERYTVGADQLAPTAKKLRKYGPARENRAPKRADKLGAYGLVEKAEAWLGKELPYQEFFTGDKQQYDLTQFRGEKPVVLIVLRGFVREVCIYCATQTKAVDNSYAEFEDRGVEVAVVYPGDEGRMDTFLKSFETEALLNGEPQMPVLYDPDSTLVTEMGIESELAIPSTFILDREGKIRYAYVGTEIDDRPSVKEVLTALDSL